jgi:tetratricopeptide (TPR) repeat protein
MQGYTPEALAGFKAVLARAPRREAALAAAAEMAASLRRYEVAQDYWQQAVDVNPWSARYRANYADVLARRGRWPAALAECRAALRLNPARDVRKLLITCLLRTGDRAGAEAEFQTLLRGKPGEERGLRAWWAAQAR